MDNPRIIHAPINNGRRYGITSPITQYDYGYLLLPEGVELPTIYEIDFSNDEHKGTSLTVYGGAEGAEVPEELIRTGKDVFAFYYKVGDGYGKTDFTWRIPNHCRPSRDGETPTPSQQSSIDQLIVRSNEAVESAEQSASEASASAQNASADAERAEEARTDAQNYATQAEQARDDAQTYANNASASATASAQSAEQSAINSADAQDSAEEAQGYANASAQSASASANSASQAQGYAQSASASAQSASGYASNAQSYSQTASAKAQDASGYAQTASQKASEASQSATNASQSAQTAEQAKTDAQTAQGLAESASDSAQGYAEDAQGYAEDAQASAEGISASASQIAQNTANILKAFPTDTASGTVASFSDGADNIPLKSLIVNIDPVQDTSSGDPSPENICPISGWTWANVTREGKNLLSHTFNSATISTNGTITASNSYYCKAGYIKAGKTYYTNSVLAAYHLTLPTKGDRVPSYDGRRYNLNGSFVAPIDGYVILRFPASVEQPMMSLDGSDYEPYQGRSITIDLGQTVYGGKLDVLTGKLTAYPYYASYNGETLTGEWISDRDVYAVGTTPTIGAQVVNIGAQGVIVQLEPHEVESLYGVNNIWADTGDTIVEYRANTKLWVQKKIAEAISALS